MRVESLVAESRVTEGIEEGGGLLSTRPLSLALVAFAKFIWKFTTLDRTQ